MSRSSKAAGGSITRSPASDTPPPITKRPGRAPPPGRPGPARASARSSRRRLGHRVALLAAGCDVLAGDALRRAVAEPEQDHRLGPPTRPPARAHPAPAPRRSRTAPSSRAGRSRRAAILDHLHVPDLRTDPEPAAVQSPVQHEAAADAGARPSRRRGTCPPGRRRTGPRPRPPRWRRSHDDRQADPLRDLLTQRLVAPAEQVGREADDRAGSSTKPRRRCPTASTSCSAHAPRWREDRGGGRPASRPGCRPSARPGPRRSRRAAPAATFVPPTSTPIVGS